MNKKEEDFLESIKHMTEKEFLSLKKQAEVICKENDEDILLGTKVSFTLLGGPCEGMNYSVETENGVPLKNKLEIPIPRIVEKNEIIDWAIYEWNFDTNIFKFKRIIKKLITW